MTIKFICTCGKHLRARDEMAARRSVCPRCGSPVGIPSLQATHSGTTAAPLTPAERLRLARQRAPQPITVTPEPPRPAARPVDPRLVRLLSSRAVRPPDPAGRHLEKHWYQSLAYPLRAWRLCLGLALFLTAVTIVTVLVLPFVLARPDADPVTQTIVQVACVVVPVLVLGVPCSFLDAVLASAASGEVYYIVLAGGPVVAVLRSGVKWIMSFLAGPLLFAALGYWYWLRCGDPGFVDYAILTELGVATVVYWLLALAAWTDRGRLRDLNPVAVADLAHRLGWRALAVVAGAALTLLAHGGLVLLGAAALHTETLRGLATLTIGWLSAMYWGTFFCRLLGVWCFRSRLP